MSIDIENIRKRFGNAEVLSDINLKIASGEMIALLGPSGQAKRRSCAFLPDWRPKRADASVLERATSPNSPPENGAWGLSFRTTRFSAI